jgi:dihydrofolate reductase
MARLIVSENISLDWVVEDPTGEDGTQRGGWFERAIGDDRAAWAAAEFQEAQDASALLLGRRSDDYFGSRWNAQPGDWAERLRQLPKYVVSSTIDEPVWQNSTVLSDDVVEEVRELKSHIDGDIVVYASRPLVQTLLEHDLVDEIRLMVFPVVLGSGRRLFDGVTEEKPVRLRGSRPIGAGIVQLVYDVRPQAGATAAAAADASAASPVQGR